jgi:hypothetical protein
MLEEYLKDLRFHDDGDVAGADIAGERFREKRSQSARDELGPEHEPRRYLPRQITTINGDLLHNDTLARFQPLQP